MKRYAVMEDLAPPEGIDWMRKKRQLGMLIGLYVVFVLVGWVMLWVNSTYVLTPLGVLPILIMACGMLSNNALIGGIAGAVILYGLILLCLLAVGKGKRWGCVFLTILMTLDLALNIIFTVSSWWCLVAAALDVLWIILLFRLSFQTE